MSDDVTVIQADRDAAAAFMQHFRPAGWENAVKQIPLGNADLSYSVQQFAKHRLSTPSPDSGERMRGEGVSEYEILHSEDSDSIVLCDPTTHDDIAEVFHCDRHTVNQTAAQAMDTARLFASAGRVQRALRELLVVAGTPITQRQEAIFAEARAALQESA